MLFFTTSHTPKGGRGLESLLVVETGQVLPPVDDAALLKAPLVVVVRDRAHQSRRAERREVEVVGAAAAAEQVLLLGVRRRRRHLPAVGEDVRRHGDDGRRELRRRLPRSASVDRRRRHCEP